MTAALVVFALTNAVGLLLGMNAVGHPLLALHGGPGAASAGRAPLLVGALLAWMFRRGLPGRALAPAHLSRPALLDPRLLATALGATGLVLAGFLAGLPLAWTALAGAALVMAVGRLVSREALLRGDWPHLLSFGGGAWWWPRWATGVGGERRRPEAGEAGRGARPASASGGCCAAGRW